MLDLIKLNLATVADLTSLQTQINDIINNPNPYVQYVDQTSQGVDGGTFTSGSWVTRELNTTQDSLGTHGTTFDDGTNTITLAANSTYLIRWSAPAYAVDGHMSRLYDVTDAVSILNGTSEYSQQAAVPLEGISQSRSTGMALVTTSGVTKDIRVEHQCETTHSSNGLGVASWSGDGILTTINIEKLA